MSDPDVNDGEVQVIKNAVLGFVNAMKSEKRMVEQQIRERTENVRSQALSTGQSQFSYQDVDDLSRQYKDEFLSYYRNTIHLKLLSNGSRHIKAAIQQGLISADVVQQEWLDGFEALQAQINKYQEVADRAEALETELEGNIAVQGDISQLRAAIKERDQLISEKDTEIMNLNEGLARMENQVNAMGQSMLENSMTIEELQEAINDRDIQIHQLRGELEQATGNSAEMELLQHQLQEARDRERELQQIASSASSDLVTQLQDNLEKTREQVLDLRRDLVQKNEELHSLRLEQDEHDVKYKQQEEKISELSSDRTKLSQEKEELNKELNEIREEKLALDRQIKEKVEELSQISSKLSSTENELQEMKVQLEGYEGKVAMSAEEQERINHEMETLTEQLKLYKEMINYLKGIIGTDVKFKIVTLMSTMSEKVRLDDLAESIEVPEKVVLRAVMELSDQGVMDARKEGRHLFCSITDDLSPPLLLTSE